MKVFSLQFVARAVCATALLASALVSSAATIVISSRDAAGIGFNDTTPVAPVGGNNGTTLGQQRMNVYRYVADLWEAALTSNAPITVSAGWEALTCTAGSAVLGSASSWNGWSDFPNAPRAGTWYPQALANKLANLPGGQSLADYYEQVDDGTGYGNVDIKTQFNINLGRPDCLAGTPFYLGLDGNAPVGTVNFATTLLHELGHGLGFSVFTTNTATGAQFLGQPSIWEYFMVDNSSGKTWTQMTNTERVASAINFRRLAWSGANSLAAVPFVLTPGATAVPNLTISGPAAGASGGNQLFATAAFGPALGASVSGQVMPVVSNTTAAGLTGPGCGPLTALDALAVNGRVALIDRGVCGFAVKVKNAQNAGAVGVLIANTAAGVFGTMGGADATITIPSLMVTNAEGNALKLALQRRSRTASGVVATFGALPTGGSYIGTDALNRPLLYTPNPRAPGSSVSHWDTIATRNLLMEPFISADLTFGLTAPFDLTLPLLRDLGW
jgi:PA domain